MSLGNAMQMGGLRYSISSFTVAHTPCILDNLYSVRCTLLHDLPLRKHSTVGQPKLPSNRASSRILSIGFLSHFGATSATVKRSGAMMDK
jgi:hypothetical protein